MTDDIEELHNRMGRVGQALARQLSAALAENARLRAALAPFAAQAATHGDQIPDTMFIDDYERDTTKPWKSAAGITVGDLRRARDALSPPSSV